MKKFIFNFLFLFCTLLIIDNLILFLSPSLPWSLVQSLSQKSQVKYKIKNGDNSIFNYDEFIYTFKPNSKIPH